MLLTMYLYPKSTERTDWKEVLKQEIMEDVKSQMKGLTQELMKEIRPLLQVTGNTQTAPS